ncbi:MAG: tetratricopeptide repeat protein [Nitrospirae bacterium]|nr:tetratricopeptide repeat protein [Nitrospirota bacterium]
MKGRTINTIKFHFITPVWGNKFTRTFLDLSLPSQLSEGNIRSLDRSTGHKYKIFTTSEDALTIRESRSYKILGGLMETEIHIIDDAVSKFHSGKINRYDVMTLCHGRGIMEAARDQAAIVSLSADLIFSNGSISNMHKIASSGKRVIAIGGYRMTLDTFGPALLKDYYLADEGSIGITSREMIRLSLEHIHPDSEILFWGNRNFLNDWPAYLYWHVPGEGVVQRGIHLSPIMINPAVRNEVLAPESGMGIDGYDYMMRAVPDYNDFHIVDDSDEITCFSMHPLPASGEPPYEANILDIAAWIMKHCCDCHVKFLDTTLRFHHSDLSREWKAVEAESDRTVEAIRTTLDFLKKTPDTWKALEALKAEHGRRNGLINELSRVVVKLNSESAVAYNKLGEELYKSGQVRDAELNFNNAVALVPNFDIAHSNLAVLCWENGEHDKAIKHVEYAYRLSPKDPAVMNVYETICSGLGIKNFDKGKIEDALSWLRKALDIGSSEARSICRLGLSKWTGNDRDSAFERFKRALDSDPGDRVILEIIFIASWEMDRLEETENHLKYYLSHHGDDAYIAWCLERLSGRKDGETAFRESPGLSHMDGRRTIGDAAGS